jgi:hypothetical protein
MKIFLSLLALSLPALATAKSLTACEKYLTCGVYEGSGSYRTPDGQELGSFFEKVTISSTSESEARMVIYVRGKNSGGSTFELDITFSQGGAFRMTQHGRLYATGICGLGVCTYGMIPFLNGASEVTVANAGFMRFTAKGLERHMLSEAVDGRQVQLSVLERR